MSHSSLRWLSVRPDIEAIYIAGCAMLCPSLVRTTSLVLHDIVSEYCVISTILESKFLSVPITWLNNVWPGLQGRDSDALVVGIALQKLIDESVSDLSSSLLNSVWNHHDLDPCS